MIMLKSTQKDTADRALLGYALPEFPTCDS